MASRVKLSGTELRRLRNDRRACDEIKADFDRAMKAGVPGLVELQERLDYHIERLDKLIAMLGGEE